MSVKQLKVLRVPLAMCTQHPDSASKYIDANSEIEEAIHDLLPFEKGGFCCDEKMIDYEGKTTPYDQPKRIIEKCIQNGLNPGKDFILTIRLPHYKHEEIDKFIITAV